MKALSKQSEVIIDNKWQNLESISDLILNMVLRDASASKNKNNNERLHHLLNVFVIQAVGGGQSKSVSDLKKI